MSDKYQPCTLKTAVSAESIDSLNSESLDSTSSMASTELTKNGFLFILFSLWFLSLPFTVISSFYIGFSVDKVAAPALIAVWGGLYLTGNSRLNKEKLKFLFTALIFFFIRNISYVDNMALFSSFIWEDVIRLAYFSLPLLYIDSMQKVKAAAKLVSINAMVGCLSAFFVALGLLSLPYERFSLSRIGFGIDKSIGLFSAYGDLAQFSVFFLLLAVYMPSSLITRKIKLLKVSAFSIVVMGLIGNQSRSFLLSVIAALLVSYLFSFRSEKNKSAVLFNAIIVFLVFSVMAIIGVFFSDIISLLSAMGGSQAQATAEGRLTQYQMAFDLIWEFPFFGVDSEFFSKYSEYIHGIHNMWLGQLTRGGIASTIVLMSLFFMIYRGALGLFREQETRSYGLVIIGYLFSLLVSILFYPADSSLFWVLLGMGVAFISVLRDSKLKNKERRYV